MTANEINALVDRLREQRNLSDAEFKTILETDAYDAALQKAADEVRRAHYGTDVYVRGLIEFTNYCKNNCYYCGIRRDNRNATRYRLTKEEILSCCAEGYDLGFRTFVLQGGEDPFYTDDLICEIVAAIHAQHPDCAITLSIGEKSRESYQKYFDAGANRYLLRHETADPEHYGKLHPNELSALHRQACLFDLKDIGYQVGSGFMVGSPYQTTENLISDLRFLQKFGHDRHRAVYHARADAVCKRKERLARADTAASLNIAFVVSVCAFAVYDGAWHHSPARARAGAEGGRKRCDAEPFAGARAKAL